MKRMSMGALASLAILAGAATLAVAQERPRPEGPGRAERALAGPGVERVMALRERLALTDEQLAQLGEIRSELSERRMAERERLLEQRAGTRERIEGVLTAEQRLILEEARADRVEGARERPGRLGGGQRGAGLRGPAGLPGGGPGSRRNPAPGPAVGGPGR